MEKNKVTTYLLYAVGEIVLVVVGILIAVSIDDWNEVRKDKTKTLEIYERLLQDIVIIQKDVDNSLLNINRNLKNAILVQEALEKKELPASMVKNFETHLNRYYQFNFTIQDSHTINELLNSGDLDLIENRWIRDAFSELAAERDFVMEVNRSFHIDAIQSPDMFKKHVRYHYENINTDSVESIPYYDFNAMAADPLLINKVSQQSKAWIGISGMFKNYRIRVNQIKDSIQIELKKFK